MSLGAPPRMDWSEGYKPRIAQRFCLCPEPEGSRGEKRAQSERDNIEAQSRGEKRAQSERDNIEAQSRREQAQREKKRTQSGRDNAAE